MYSPHPQGQLDDVSRDSRVRSVFVIQAAGWPGDGSAVTGRLGVNNAIAGSRDTPQRGSRGPAFGSASQRLACRPYHRTRSTDWVRSLVHYCW